LLAAWFATRPAQEASATSAAAWVEPPWQRLAELPSTLLGGVMGSGQPRVEWWIGGAVLLLLPILFGRLDRRSGGRWVPLAAALGLYLASPNRGLGVWFVYPRMAVFVAAFLLLMVRPATSPRRRRLGRGLTCLALVAWMAFLTVQFRAVDAEARGIDVLLEHTAPGRNVVGLIFEPGVDVGARMPVFGHFHAWYVARHGGRADFSFAMYFPQIVHYRPGQGPLADPLLNTRPDQFTWQRGGRADYFVVRAPRDFGPVLFRDAEAPVVLRAQSGHWWLYERLTRPEPSPEPRASQAPAGST
jgi:hypothetical protein